MSSPGPDIAAVLARAQAACHHAELVRDLAFEVSLQSMITTARAEAVQLSPVVEARLRLLLVDGHTVEPTG